MTRLQIAALTALALGLVASVAATGGTAWYLRSAGYRAWCSRQLEDVLHLPSAIGAVTPRSLQSREFNEVHVWLPQKRDSVFHCRSAIYEARPTPQDREAYVLQLSDGACEISTRTWLAADYRYVVESGLRPGFMPGGPDEVSFSGMDVVIARDTFRMRLQQAAGSVRFESERHGTAAVFCRTFNGHTAADPVTLTAAFSPQSGGVRIDRLELSTPALPLRIVGLGDLFGARIESGEFRGRLSYAESAAGRLLMVSGRCEGLALREFIAPLLPGDVSGTCDELELLELRVVDRVPQRLRFRGVIRGTQLGQLLAPLGFERLGGATTLQVREADLTSAGIAAFSASGECRGASLDGLTTGLQLGRASGRVNITISDLRVVDNRLVALDAELRIDEAGDEPLWVDGELLTTVAQRALGDQLPAFLRLGPGTRISYKHLGVRLDVRDEQLRLLGTHGPRSAVILTVPLLGRDVAAFSEPAEPIDLRPYLDEARRQAAAAAAARWPAHWRPAASNPVE